MDQLRAALQKPNHKEAAAAATPTTKGMRESVEQACMSGMVMANSPVGWYLLIVKVKC